MVLHVLQKSVPVFNTFDQMRQPFIFLQDIKNQIRKPKILETSRLTKFSQVCITLKYKFKYSYKPLVQTFWINKHLNFKTT